jgi:hypothetical protein
MQINKSNKTQSTAPKREPAKYVPKEKLDATEDALIDLYDEPLKKKHEDDDLVINIDFSKPIEFLGKIARWLAKWLRVAQSHITRENAERIKSYAIKNKKIVIPATCGFILLFGLINFWPGSSADKSSSGVQGETSTTSIETDVSPEFNIVYPQDKNKEDVGSVAKISPPGAPPTYAYVDNIEGKEVQVSQQQLPDRFKTNQDAEFKEFATNFSANTRVDGDSFTAYLGISVDGQQSVVMIKDDLLILLKSKQPIVAETWSTYLSNLQYK